MSFTFIASLLDNNPILERKDPGYRSRLLLLPQVERERLLRGNWKVRPHAGSYFQRSWVRVVDEIPPEVEAIARGWDRAATVRTVQNPDPDYTATVKLARLPKGQAIILHAAQWQISSGQVEDAWCNLATQDGTGTIQAQWQDPGAAGKSEAQRFASLLPAHEVDTEVATKNKTEYFCPFSSAAEHGRILVLRGAWNELLFTALEGFPEAKHDDIPDALSRAYRALFVSGAFLI